MVTEKTDSTHEDAIDSSVLSAMLGIFLRGLAMGAADIVPGVSGGTIALITGIYPRLIHGIDVIIKNAVRALKALVTGRFRDAFSYILENDLPFFIPLFSGIVLSFLTLAHTIHYLLENQVSAIYAFFFGLIAASSIYVLRQTGKFGVTTFVMSLIGAVFAYIFVGAEPLNAYHTLPVLFGSGCLAICAMILPGISGSFILVFLGQYQYMLSALSQIVIKDIVSFIAGACVGITLFSRLIDYLLTKWRLATLSFITGLMIGSLRLPYIKVTSTEYSLMPVMLWGCVGFALVLVVETVSKNTTHTGK